VKKAIQSKRAIARLVPERSAAPVALPDFTAMLKEIYGNRKLKVTGADLIRADRDRYWVPTWIPTF
jgi:hypothetical protein